MSEITAESVSQAAPYLLDGVELSGDPAARRIRGPSLKRGPIRRRVARMMRLADHMEVELDDIGSWVIDRFDGQRTMEILADELADHLKLTTREAEAALTTFVRALLRRKLIRLEWRNEPA